jgi:hypothetical protein
MRDWLRDFRTWSWRVMSGWQQYAGAGGTGLAWVLIEKARKQPLSWSILGYTALVFLVLACFNEWRKEHHRSIVPPQVSANLTTHSFYFGPMGYEKGIWSRNHSANAGSYRAVTLEVRNNIDDNREVGEALDVSAQAIFYSNGAEICDGAPLAWENEDLNSIRIPVGHTKSLLVIVRDSPFPYGGWQVVTNQKHERNANGEFPMKFKTFPIHRYGEVKITILCGSKVLNAEKFEWRITDSEMFLIDPIRQLA